MVPSRDSKKRKYPSSLISAFSLVEVMVGMAVLAILIVLFGQMLSKASQVWTQTESNKSRMQNARAIADTIGGELKSALVPVNRLDSGSLQFVVNPVLSPDYLNRDAIFWQAPVANVNTAGDVAEIGYYVKWDVSNPKNPKSQLCRFFVDALTSVPAAVGDPAPGSCFKIYSAPNNWIDENILDIVAPGTGAGYRGLFAENVLGLWIKCVDFGGNDITLDCTGAAFPNEGFDSRLGFTYKDPTTGNTRTTPAYAKADGSLVRESVLPPAVDVSLILLDPETAGRIDPATKDAITAAVQAAPDAESFLNQVMTDNNLTRLRKGVRSYRTRVHLQNSR